MRSVLAGLARYLPENIVTNRDLEKMVDTTDQWIVERTGIHQRHIADKKTSASDLAVPAAREALKQAGLKPEEVELIIVGTSTPDMMFPSTACFVQGKIGATKAAAFDQLAACSGFLFSLATADQYLRSGMFSNALVIGAEVYSSILDWEDRTTCVLFGDGAGAAVLKAEKGSRRGILSAALYSDGSKWDYLYTPGGGSAMRFTDETVKNKDYCLKMQGNRTFKVAIKSMADAAQTALDKAGLTPADIKLVIPHQANKRIIDGVAKMLGMDPGIFYMNIDRVGNTAAASIPIALTEAMAEGRAKEGDLVLMVAFGGGFTWASVLLRL